jgi:GNAT superfamily N-acetyltransferase
MRAASASDAKEVASLLALLGYPTTPKRARDQLRHGTDHGSEVIVAETPDHKVAGFVSLQHVYMLAEDKRACRLSAIAVREDVRGHGVGKALVEAVETRAREVGASVVWISSGFRPERASAHRLYTSLGYVGAPSTDHVEYSKSLSE